MYYPQINRASIWFGFFKYLSKSLMWQALWRNTFSWCLFWSLRKCGRQALLALIPRCAHGSNQVSNFCCPDLRAPFKVPVSTVGTVRGGAWWRGHRSFGGCPQKGLLVPFFPFLFCTQNMRLAVLLQGHTPHHYGLPHHRGNSNRAVHHRLKPPDWVWRISSLYQKTISGICGSAKKQHLM